MRRSNSSIMRMARGDTGAEQRFRAVVELAPDATVVADHEGRITFVNRQAEALFGYPRAEMLGQPVELLIPAQFHEAHRQHRSVYVAAPRTRPMGVSLRLSGRRRDGSEFPVEVSLSPLEDGSEALVIASIRDVSERRRLEAAWAAVEAASAESRQLQRITDAALTHTTLDGLLSAVLGGIRTVMAVDNVAILLTSEDGRELILSAAQGPEEVVAHTVRMPIGQGVAGRIAETRQPLVVDDLLTVEVANPLLREQFRSLVGVPLVLEGRLIGVVHADSATLRRFSEQDVRLLQLVAERIAYALDHARLRAAEDEAHREAETAAEELRRIQAVTDTALSHLTLDDLLAELLDRIHAVMGVEDIAILLLEPDGRHLVIRAARGLEDAVAAPAKIPVGQGFSGHIAATRTALVVDDVSRFTVYHEQMRQTQQSVAGVPLLVEDRLLGVVYVGSATERHFSEQDVQLLQRVADRMALAIDRARTYEMAMEARSEATRQASELRATLDTMTDAVMVYDADGQIVNINAAARTLFGFDRYPGHLTTPAAERALLVRLSDEHGEPLALEQRPAKRILRGEVLAREHAVDVIVEAPDGRELLLSATGAPLRDAAGQISGGVLVLRDVTERRRLEREHAQQADQLDRIFEGISDGLVVYDAEGTIVRVNAAARSILGLPVTPSSYAALPAPDRGALYTVYDEHGNLLTPEDWPLVRVLRGKATGTEGLDVRMRTLDGREVEVYTSATPLRDPEGHLVGVVTILRDQSERKRLEREREEARIREQATREVNQHMRQFMFTASHELRNPVAAAIGTVQLTQRRIGRLTTAGDSESSGDVAQPPYAWMLRDLAKADQALHRLDRLIARLFDVTQAQTGQLQLMLARQDLTALVRAAVEAQRIASPGRAIELETLADQPVAVIADADRLDQVLSNYLSNAMKYSPPDEAVVVRVEVDEGARARVSVRDRGPGLLLEEQGRVWELFHRVPGTEEQEGQRGSLGLGLYLCKTLIDQHGGEVGVESTPGQGATFWFALPVASGAVSAAESASA
ncbi:MAG: hypothetical protein OJF49_002727 [Ktedonobacterales bacterium]|jgi:PAS domain S-box-containing protein|nr:MAG: hypothetical protein OJF49_002727 [Ktedonobacterales bacterium]